MTATFASLQVNPFEDDVVREPREVSFSVNGLNDAPLQSLVTRFAALDAGAAPRSPPAKPSKAQLVVSPDRGYGKSHLLGRLFAQLGRRATKVYLRPFQDPTKAWHSILLLSIQELERPDDDTTGEPSQLEALAFATLGHLAADFIADGGIPDYPQVSDAVSFLRGLPDLSDAQLRPWIEWMAELLALPRQLTRLAHLLRRRGIDLHGHEKAWLKVLAAYALDEPQGERRATAVKWLRAEPLETEEIALLRLHSADSEGRGDASAQEINDLSFRRLKGLCQLGCFFRPFLFCFDQTEFYASDPALIRTLGNCIDQLYVDLRNHLTVITANQENWVTEVLPQIAPPQRNRIEERALRLEGIKIDGARELLTARLQAHDLGAPDIVRFFAENWLEQAFSPLPEFGVRALLMRAAERFRELTDRPPVPPPTLDDLFRLQVNDVRSKKALLVYNQDALMWFVKDIAKAATRTQGRRYFSVEWAWPDRTIYFAFEGGDNSQRWRGIANEALAMAKSRAAGTTLAYVFRTPDLTRVPRPTWTAVKPIMASAREQGFHVIELTLDQVCELHAARELYSNALQGNIVFSGVETLAWLRGHFALFLTELAFRDLPAEIGGAAGDKPAATPAANRDSQPQPSSGDLDAGHLGVVLEMVREQRIVDIAAVLGRLGSADLRDPLLRSVEAHPNLKAHPDPRPYSCNGASQHNGQRTEVRGARSRLAREVARRHQADDPGLRAGRNAARAERPLPPGGGAAGRLSDLARHARGRRDHQFRRRPGRSSLGEFAAGLDRPAVRAGPWRGGRVVHGADAKSLRPLHRAETAYPAFRELAGRVRRRRAAAGAYSGGGRRGHRRGPGPGRRHPDHTRTSPGSGGLQAQPGP